MATLYTKATNLEISTAFMIQPESDFIPHDAKLPEGVFCLAQDMDSEADRDFRPAADDPELRIVSICDFKRVSMALRPCVHL